MATYELITGTSAPELAEEAGKWFAEGWPEFIFHDRGVEIYRDRRTQAFGDWDFYYVDEERTLVGGCWAVPIQWDGTEEGLPAGFTDAMARSVEGHEAGTPVDTLVVMAAAIRSDVQGQGHAGRLLTLLRDRATAAGLHKVIAPVRPTLKSSYPLHPIELFATWTRPDGLPLDPWLRTHARLGATVIGTAPRSQTITGTVADWESWTGLALPVSGAYVIPAGLELLYVDRDADLGTYHDPNVWMRHL